MNRTARASVLLAWTLLASGSHAPVHASALDGNITYILPLYLNFQGVTPDTLRENVDLLRARIGEGTYVKVGFSVYIFVSMSDWLVDINNPDAVRNALTDAIAQIDAAIARARSVNIPISLSILTASRSRYDPVQMASELEDRRNMQWYSDNKLANGWWSYSRYARKQRAVQEAYIRALGRVIGDRMQLYPETVVAAAGDGEVELSFDHPQLTYGSSFLADYSPFAVAEFRDWLRNGGLYAGTLSGQGYEQGARYAGDDSPNEDTNHDGHTLNRDFNTNFSTWNLRYFDWSLQDDPYADPKAIPASAYTRSDWNPFPDAGASYFDPPRTRQPGNAWWEVWMRFRQTMIWRHNQEFAKWMTTPNLETGPKVPKDRWYSYQIPADYLFGHTPENPDYRLDTSASPWWTADVTPYGSLGISAFNLTAGDGGYARTLAQVAPLIAARGVRWGILEWNPSIPPTDSAVPYRAEMAVIERYRPSLIVPFAWDYPGLGVLDNGFEIALRRFVDRNKNGPPPLPPADDVAIDFGPTNGLYVLYDNGPGSPPAGNGAGYFKLHPLSPEEMAVGDLDGNGKSDLILDFPGYGVWVWFNNASWFQLHPANVANMVTADLDGNGKADVILDFPGFGIWVWYNNERWSQLHVFNPSRMVAGDLDGNLQTDLVIDFPGFGVWVWFNNSFWYQLHPLNGINLATGDLDGGSRSEVLITFRGFGLWVWRNNASWFQLHARDASMIATGDLDGNGQLDAIIDFPGSGLWVWSNNRSWYQLHPFDAQGMTVGDIDGNRQGDVIIDFGAPGLWAWVNSSAWVQLHTLSPEGLASGDLDGQ